MTQAHDAAGLPITADDSASGTLLDNTVHAYLTFRPETGQHIKTLLTTEPTLPMGNVLMGYFYLLMGVRPLVKRAKGSAESAREQFDRLTAREQGHVRALEAWSNDNLAGALVEWEAILLEAPRDILAAKLAHFGHFYLGDSENIRDSIARILPAWSENDAGYGPLLSMYAFGLEETGDFAEAEVLGRQAVARDANDTWGIHAVAHVYEMQDRHQEGIDWLDQMESAWSAANNFRYHVAWHRALYYVDGGDYDGALDLYDRTIWDPESREYLDLCNDISLLVRLDIAGIDVGDRFEQLADVLESHANQHMLNFIEPHYALGLARAGRKEAATQIGDDIQSALDDTATDSFSAVAAAVGLDLVKAATAYGLGDYAAAVDLLYPIRYDVRRIGGSHAQRDLFAQMLIDAADKAERTSLTRALVAERRALKPNNAFTRSLTTVS